jgi:hypothetical protein
MNLNVHDRGADLIHGADHSAGVGIQNLGFRSLAM